MAHISRLCVLLVVAQLPLFAQAPARPLRLSGVANMGYTNSRVSANFPGANSVGTGTPEFYWGLDFSARTYILDPRFISLALEPSVLRANGSENETDIHRSTTGGNFYLDFLPQTYYPFHFHFIDQNADYVRGHLNTTSSVHRSIGFDWTFRKPHLPSVLISYESGSTNYLLSESARSLSHAKTFSAVAHGKLDGWVSTFAYSKQSATEAFSGTDSRTDLFRGSTWKEVFADSRLAISALYQTLRLKGRQDLYHELPFAHLNADFGSRVTEKLNTNVYYRYSWLGNVRVAQIPPDGAGGVPATAPQTITGSTSFHTVGAGLVYQLFRGLSVGETNEVSFTNTLNDSMESPTRTVNVVGNLNWSRRVNFIQTRAGYQRGLVYTATNFGNSRAVWFNSFRVGLDIGDRRTVLVQGDYSFTNRPDLFQIGGRYSQQTLQAGIETRALKIFNLTASAGRNRTDLLSSRGRERYHTTAYSLGLQNRRLSIQASRNSNVGLQNLLFSPLELDPGRIFRVLPVETLLNAPFSATLAVYTTASATLRLNRDFDAQFRYIRQRFLFPFSPNELVKQYDLSGGYRLGKFTFRAGVLVNHEDAQNLSQRRRRYYYFRLSRPFRIL